MNESHERAEARKWTTSLGDPPKWAQVGLKVAQIKGFEGDLKNKMVKAEAHKGKGGGWYPMLMK